MPWWLRHRRWGALHCRPQTADSSSRSAPHASPLQQLWQTVMGTGQSLQQESQGSFSAAVGVPVCSLGLLTQRPSQLTRGAASCCLSQLSSLQHVLLDLAWWCHAGWGDATTACAHSRSVDPGLPSPDTVVSCLSYSTGSAATVSITFASPNSRFSLSVVGTEGSLGFWRVHVEGPEKADVV